MSHRALSVASVIRSTARVLAATSAIAVAAAVTALSAPAQAAVVAPTILLPNMTVAEGDAGTAAFTVNVGLTAPNPFNHTVKLQVVDFTSIPLPGGGGTYGTATPGSDYVPFGSFYLSFKPGQQVARFTVKIKGDTVVEPDEQIDVRFDDTEFNVGDNDIDLWIANDDGGAKPSQPLLLPPNQTMPEPDSGCFAYNVTIPVSKPVKKLSTVDAVDFTSIPLPPPLVGTYGDATPGVDYKTFGSKTLSYAAGSRVAVLPITICGDTTVEADEQIDVRFDNTTSIAISDNDIDFFLSNND
jgi:Calx-beta domain